MSEERILTEYGDAVLCYAEHTWAWFTTQALEDQWGDDWNDAPWEHNAERPYQWREYMDVPEYEIIRVAWSGPYELPGEWETNSRWSVQDINAGAVAWLIPGRYEDTTKVKPIPAGTSLADFCDLIEGAGGTVYLPKEPNP